MKTKIFGISVISSLSGYDGLAVFISRETPGEPDVPMTSKMYSPTHASERRLNALLHAYRKQSSASIEWGSLTVRFYPYS